MLPLLSETELQCKARKVVGQLEGVNPYEATLILNKAMTVVLKENNKIFKALDKQHVMPVNPDFFMKKQQGIIENDPEIKSFLLSLDPRTTYTDMTLACVEKFGKKRAPKRSSVGRWFLKMKKLYINQADEK